MTTLFRKILNLIIVFFIVSNSAITGSGSDKNIEAIRQNIIDGILGGDPGPFSASDIKDADKIIALTADDGKGGLYFTDVDYANEDRAFWVTTRHVTRTERLAILYTLEEDSQLKAEYRDCVLRLLDHWINNDYQNSNWYYNRLSNPNILGEIGILMKPELSRRQLIRLSELVSRGSFTVTPVLYDHTGANAMELALSTIKFGVLTGSKAAIKEAVNVVTDVLGYTGGEGLNTDGTFFQHGNRIYMGGYGVVYIGGALNVIRLLNGSEYGFTAEQLTPLSHFILEGMRTLSFGSTLDPTTMGRSVSRQNPQPLGGLAPTLRKLAQVSEIPGKDEILAYADSIENDTKSNYGMHYFETAKFLVVNTDNFYFSFRGGAEDLVYSEIINSENVLSYNSSFPGVTTIMSTGREYRNIAPVFDYSFVPGATAVYESDSELLAHEDFTYRYLDGVFGSEIADGAGVVFAKTSHEGIDMTVACFADNSSAVLLGAGMRDSAGRQMNTCIDQCFLAGDYTVDGRTVTHNGIKYTVLEGGKLTASAEHRRGNWTRNNPTLNDKPADGDIFTVSLANTGSYAYSVMSTETDSEYEVIVNTESVQAVRMPDGRIAAAFYTDTSFTFDGVTYSGKAGEGKIY